MVICHYTLRRAIRHCFTHSPLGHANGQCLPFKAPLLYDWWLSYLNFRDLGWTSVRVCLFPIHSGALIHPIHSTDIGFRAQSHFVCNLARRLDLIHSQPLNFSNCKKQWIDFTWFSKWAKKIVRQREEFIGSHLPRNHQARRIMKRQRLHFPASKLLTFRLCVVPFDN